jgi:hypothetical protein
MFRTSCCLLVTLLIAAGGLHGVSAQSTNPPGAGTAAPAATNAPASKPSRIRLTAEKLKEMKAKWSANRPKLRACRKQVRAKGLAGDERWFYIEDCMERS